MLEALHARAINIHNMGNWGSARGLGHEYMRIYDLLSNYLDEEQIIFLPKVSRYPDLTGDVRRIRFLQGVITSCNVAISYLNSLDMNLDKELIKKKEELILKEKYLEIKEKEVESYQKLLQKSLEAIKQYPELQRSRTVEETKKSHRQIEENSRKKELEN